MTFRRYATALLGVVLGLVAIVAVLNLAIDPYGLFGWVRVDGVNAKKVYAYTHKHLAKQTRALRMQPRTVLLGNSRVDVGLDPESEGWPAAMRPVANLGIPGDGVDGLAAAYAFAVQRLQPATVFIGLDFLDFLSATRPPPDTRPPLGDAGAVLPSLPETVFSTTALLDSLKTLAAQHNPATAAMTDAGFNPMQDYVATVRREGQWPMVDFKNRQHAEQLALRARSIRLPNGEPAAPLIHLRGMLMDAAERRQRVVLFTYPMHSQFYALLAVSDRWPLFEQWKRAVVAEWQAVRDRHPDWPSAFWDFALLAPLTTVPAPLPDDRGRRMQWYWEPGHFKAELGARLIGQMTGTAADGFGVRFDPAGLEEHLAGQRLALAAYQRTHPDDVAYLAGLCRQLGCAAGD